MRNINTKDNAIYLPAVNDSFAKGVLDEVKSGRPFPDDLSPSDLIFWNEGNKLFHYPYILHSAGLHTVGSWVDNAVTRADKSKVMILADSGGFQVGTGKLKGIKNLRPNMPATEAVSVWESAHHVRQWVLSWQESFATHAMTLDMPLGITQSVTGESPFARCSIEQLTAMTVDNLQYIDVYRQGNTRWINVVQGVHIAEIEYWWNAVKGYKFEGWSLAGGAGARGGLYQVLYTILMMRDGGAFEGGVDNLHALGVSSLKWAVFLTAIQKALRNQYPELLVTYDSSSPFQTAMVYEKVYQAPELGVEPNSWKLSTKLCEQGFRYRGSQLLFPHKSSPLAEVMTLGDLNVKGGETAKKHFDSLSLYMLTHHNVYVQLDAIQKANEAAFGVARHEMTPKAYLDVIDVIGEAFEVDNWREFLLGHKALLDSVAPNAYVAETKVDEAA